MVNTTLLTLFKKKGVNNLELSKISIKFVNINQLNKINYGTLL